MTDRDLFRNLAKTASKKQNKGTLMWLIRMNRKSLEREGVLLKNVPNSRFEQEKPAL